MSHFNDAANQWDTPDKIERTRVFAEAIRKRVQLARPGRLIDFGCGTGLLCSHFQDIADEILGIDTSPGMLEAFTTKFKKLPQVHSLNLDLESSDLNVDKKYDLVMSSMAFHHLESPATVLKKFKSVLSPGGRIAVIDLDEEDGSFHVDPSKMGVRHFGFSAAQVEMWASESRLDLLSRDIIFTIKKDSRSYPVFLAVFGPLKNSQSLK